MKVMLKKDDVVWSDDSGGEGQSPYHIRIIDPKKAASEDSYTSCWCPKEAVEFLRYLGIKITTAFYSSGYGAQGCFWDLGKQEMSPHIKAAWMVYSRQMGSNKQLVKNYGLLQKPED